MIGKTIAHYTILEKLGEGGMGVVYKAEDIRLKREVAIKFLPRHIAGNAEDRERFKIEAQAAAALNHPNIATIYAIEEFEDDVFIVMEYIDGQELKDLIAGNVGAKHSWQESDTKPANRARNASPLPLPLDDVINYTTQIASGLQTAHAKGIIHRDIKSSNIMVTNTGQVKIMDFGLAKIGSGSQLTQDHSTLGTAAYMSPEQASGEAVDHRSDIWSFGVVLYEMLIGKLPFDAEYNQAVLYNILNTELPPISDHRDNVPDFLQIILTKLLQKSPDHRYQDFGQILADLKSQNIGQVEATRRVAPTPRILIFGGMAILILLTALAWFFIGRSPDSGTTPETPGRNSIAVMYFENRSSEENLDKILVDMLTTNLAQYKGLNVVSSQRLFDILKNMDKLDVETINKKFATEIARKAGVSTMMLGSIIQIGNKIRINSQLTDVNTGDIISSQQVEGEQIEDVFTMVDQLTEKVGDNLIASHREANEKPFKIAEVTTPSFEAYKYYQRGMEYIWRHDYGNAWVNLRRAIGIDSTFAMAHSVLAAFEGGGGILTHYGNYSRVQKHLELAEKYSTNVTERERLYIRYQRATRERNLAAAESLASQYVKLYPDEKVGWYDLAFLLRLQGNFRQSILYQEKGLMLDPTFAEAHNNLAYYYIHSGQIPEAISSAKTYHQLLPDIQNTYDTLWEMYIIAGHLDSAAAVCQQALALNKSWYRFYRYLAHVDLFRGDGESARRNILLSTAKNPDEDAWILMNTAYIQLYEGQYHKALENFRKALPLEDEFELSGRGSRYIWLPALHAGKMLILKKEYQQALQLFSHAKEISIQLYEDKFNPVTAIAECWSGIATAHIGEFDKALSHAQNIKMIVENTDLHAMYLDYYHLLKAEIHFLKGDAQSAWNEMDHISSLSQHSPKIKFLKAKTLADLGQFQEAIKLLQTAVADIEGRLRWGGDYFDYFYTRSLSNYWLGIFHENSGDLQQAIAYYEKAIAQWQHADDDFAELADAKARLLKLNEKS